MPDPSEPIRILHIVPDLDAGGLQNGVIGVINGLAAEAFRHEVCCLHAAGRFRTRLAPSIPVYELHAGWHDPRTALRLARIIRRSRPDVVHARNWSTWPDAALAKALARQARLVFSVHGWDVDVPASQLRALVCRQLFRWTDHLCGVSRHVAQLFAAEMGLPAERFEILPNGVDVERFKPRSDRQAVRRSLGVDPDVVLLGSVGRMEPIKDYGLLVGATADLICRHGIRCELLMVGDGSERAALGRRADEMGIGDYVHFTGWQEDVRPLLGAMDAMVMPSRREGMNNAILEAMATAVSVVATSVGGTPELVANQREGRLFRPGGHAELVDVLLELAGSPSLRHEMGTRARERVTRSFSLHRGLSRYDRMYRRLARRKEPVGDVVGTERRTMPRPTDPGGQVVSSPGVL